MELADIVADLVKRIDALEKKLPKVEEALKVQKTPLQLVVEREGNEYKARRKVLIETATETKEAWEDATNEFTQKELEDQLNGA